MQYGKKLDAAGLDRLIDVLNDADRAQQAFIDAHRSGELDATTEQLYEATYELVERLKDVVVNSLSPQVNGYI